MMKRMFCATICLLLPFLMNAHPQQQRSTGAYVTSIAGKAILNESYVLMIDSDGVIRAEGELKPLAGGTGQKTLTIAARHRPASFVAEVGGVKAIDAEFSGASVKLHMEGQLDRTLETKASVILENLVWHQFIFLLAQYDEAKGGAQNFTFFLPSRALDLPITIERTAAPTYTVNHQTIKTLRYRIVSAGQLVLDMWTDEAHTPLLFDIEAQQVQAVRAGAEALASAVSANAAKLSEPMLPAYAPPSSFHEREVIVGSGEWALHGTLTLPATGAASFPAVVLVHGSGPNDRDETIGPNKPFRDLAWGLAAEGIAVLRYEKRSSEHSAEMVAKYKDTITVKEEAIDDALAAVQLLRSTKEIDRQKIFVLGHSLGGALVPRIGLADPKLAGLIVIAGPTQPLEDAIVRQYEYAAMLDGVIDPAEKAEIEKMKASAARVKDPKLSASTPASDLPFGTPASYWLDLRGYNPAAVARRLKQPLLILQGERDYQVTLKDDLAGWKTLSDKKSVTFKTYPKLNHLFMEGEGPSSGAEYMKPANIPKYVVDDIAAWMKEKG